MCRVYQFVYLFLIPFDANSKLAVSLYFQYLFIHTVYTFNTLEYKLKIQSYLRMYIGGHSFTKKTQKKEGQALLFS